FGRKRGDPVENTKVIASLPFELAAAFRKESGGLFTSFSHIRRKVASPRRWSGDGFTRGEAEQPCGPFISLSRVVIAGLSPRSASYHRAGGRPCRKRSVAARRYRRSANIPGNSQKRFGRSGPARHSRNCRFAGCASA